MKHRMHRARLSALTLALTAAWPALAQPSPATLDEIVVTATRGATRADALVSDVVVIDGAQIEHSTARTLPELLAREAGLQMAANGGAGKTSSVFIRGTEARHTILLIDGVRYGSATAGTPVWDAVPLDAIERIEVLKGPASSLYGSEGVGGVVQIFTKKGRAGFHPYASATLGSEKHRELSAGVGGGQGALTYALGLRQQREDSFSATNERVAFGNYNPDRDPYRQDSVNGSLGLQLDGGWRADANFLYSDGLTHLDDGPGRDARTTVRSVVLGAGLTGRVLPAWQTELRFGHSADTSNAVEASWLPSDFKTTQNQWTWQNNVDTPVGVVLAGVERREQKVAGSTDYTVKDRSITGLFAGLNGSAGAHSWQVNGRHDDNSQFGSANTWFAGYGYQITPAWRVHASRGTSFVAPSFNQLYYPGFGNPLLEPERGRNTDLGVTWSAGGHEVKLVRFDNKIRGYITSGTNPTNVPRSRIEGWTLGYAGSAGPLTLRASLDLLDPRNEVSDRVLQRRAKRQATLGADYAAGAWTFGGTLLAASHRFDDAANTQRLGGYATLDLYADYAFAKDWSVRGKVNNLFDRDYETARGYNQPGRGVFVTLRWQPR
ncbi:TonB-dependent receptor domain-containing protein [Pseudorhodoferax sp.]|uniref:TonB-dependent receptor domain-containing protein n=1 Tax=Pseudorhodoferax sp. TaxID=1993553 RepID=UPI0039E606E7